MNIGIMKVNLDKFIQYPEMGRIAQLRPNPEILLGKPISWQEKRDGSNLCLWSNRKYSVLNILGHEIYKFGAGREDIISSRHMPRIYGSDLAKKAASTPEYQQIYNFI